MPRDPQGTAADPRWGSMAAPRRREPWGRLYRDAGLREATPGMLFDAFYVECTYCAEREAPLGRGVYSNCLLLNPNDVITKLGCTWSDDRRSRIRCPWCSASYFGSSATSDQLSRWIYTDIAWYQHLLQTDLIRMWPRSPTSPHPGKWPAPKAWAGPELPQ